MLDSLILRLNGIYTVPVNDGGGLLNGKDTFTRRFPVTPIQKEAAATIKSLIDLIGHCWVHSGFIDCGYDQMTTDQKRLYDEIKGKEPDHFDNLLASIEIDDK